jgi:hypothetical protein
VDIKKAFKTVVRGGASANAPVIDLNLMEVFNNSAESMSYLNFGLRFKVITKTFGNFSKNFLVFS